MIASTRHLPRLLYCCVAEQDYHTANVLIRTRRNVITSPEVRTTSMRCQHSNPTPRYHSVLGVALAWRWTVQATSAAIHLGDAIQRWQSVGFQDCSNKCGGCRQIEMTLVGSDVIIIQKSAPVTCPGHCWRSPAFFSRVPCKGATPISWISRNPNCSTQPRVGHERITHRLWPLSEPDHDTEAC
jgi:hypothetical protein